MPKIATRDKVGLVMGSTFGGLEISKRGLSVHQTALNTTGHNISNADNKNYARQRVIMESADPLYAPAYNRASTPGQLGQGVSTAAIQRIRDSFYDDQIISAESSQKYWGAHHLYLHQIENVFHEPSDNTLRSLMDKFWTSWQELANFPADVAHREVVLERGQALITRIHDTYAKLNLLRQRANQEIEHDVEQINSIAGEIRDLNERILKLQALGDNPNDLMDRRDGALEKLTGLVNVQVGRGDKDELIVFIGEQALVQGEVQRRIVAESDPSKDGYSRIVWEHNRKQVLLKDGHVHGLMEIRDMVIVGRMREVDSYATNLADVVNEVHQDGFGLNGKTNLNFFDIPTLSSSTDASARLENELGNYDLDRDGVADVTAIFRVTGTNVINPQQRLGISGVLTFFKNDDKNTPVSIDYREDETLEDVINKINDSRLGVVAYINHDKQLAIKATAASGQADQRTSFMIRHLEDSGELLVGYTGILAASGGAGAFDFRRIGEISKLRAPLQDINLTPIFHAAANIQIAANISQDPSSIAAARGKDKGGTGDYNTPNGTADNANALLIAAALKQDSRMVGHAPNFEEFYNSLIANLGTEARTAQDAAARYKDDLLELNNLRQSVMGVSLDEEMGNMIQFQHAYNASARMIQVQNEIIDTIVNRLGA